MIIIMRNILCVYFKIYLIKRSYNFLSIQDKECSDISGFYRDFDFKLVKYFKLLFSKALYSTKLMLSKCRSKTSKSEALN